VAIVKEGVQATQKHSKLWSFAHDLLEIFKANLPLAVFIDFAKHCIDLQKHMKNAARLWRKHKSHSVESDQNMRSQ